MELRVKAWLLDNCEALPERLKQSLGPVWALGWRSRIQYRCGDIIGHPMKTPPGLMLLAVLPEMVLFPRMSSVRVLQRVVLSNQQDLDTGSCASYQGVVDHQVAADGQQHPVLKVEEEYWAGMAGWPFRVADRLRCLEVEVLRLVTRVAWTEG